MRMAWWVFIFLMSVQIIFIQLMVEAYMAHEHEHIWDYVYAMGFTLVGSAVLYWFFRQVDKARE